MEDGKTMAAVVPYDGAAHVEVRTPCAACGGLKVHGVGHRTNTHDTYRCDAACLCGARRGVIFVRVSTIFGIEEDEHVLNGRARVY